MNFSCLRDQRIIQCFLQNCQLLFCYLLIQSENFAEGLVACKERTVFGYNFIDAGLCSFQDSKIFLPFSVQSATYFFVFILLKSLNF